MAVSGWLTHRLAQARGRLFVLAPVMLALGIGLYFQLPVEPAPLVFGLLGLGAAGLGLAGWRAGPGARPILWALALIAGGMVVAQARSYMVSAPVLQYRYYGPVEGRIIAIDRSQSDAVRLTLDRVRLDKMAPERIPERVRISLHGRQDFFEPEPGLTVVTTAHLSPPSGPVEAGGFDFQRMAWFRQIGAVGYTRVPVLAMAEAREGRAGLGLARLRARISGAVQAMMPGEAGAFAAALMTGDRAGMSRETLAALRGSNLAHLLAISGLHMGLLTGFVFAALRYVLALMPGLALRWPVKKIAAIGALGAGAFYLGLSGGNVATQRAFIMVAAMLIAVLFDRRALSLRAVALAALIVLVLRPESLPAPGFQMSFAATTALVAVFGALRSWQGWRAPRWARPVLALVISSAVAGAATAPFSAAHFNQISHYGLAANLLAVPLMGAVVMPGAVVAALLAPLGLSWLALAVMRPALEWIIWVAQKVSSLDGALGQIVTPGPLVLPLVAIGGLGLALLVGRVRLLGLVPLALAAGLWANTQRPDLLISQSGGLIGLMGPEGRAFNKGRGDGFVAGAWLENDGDSASQQQAAARPGFSGEKGWLRFRLGGLEVAHLSGRGARERVAQACRAGADVVILAARERDLEASCRVIGRDYLARSGVLAIYAGADDLPGSGAARASGETDGWREVSAIASAGLRPWNRAGRRTGH